MKNRAIERAYSVLTIKAINDDTRTITGIATTPSPDRMGDIVEPTGAVFSLPLPLLWQHDSDQPVGHVTEARISTAGIEVTAQFVAQADPPSLQDDLDRAWGMVKSGLVRGLSIGFMPRETSQIEGTWSYRYLSWEWLELSAVTIPANGDASIQTIKSIVRRGLAASGRRSPSVVRFPAGVSATASAHRAPEAAPSQRDNTVKTIAQQITEHEAARAAKAARMKEIMTVASEAGRTPDEAEATEFDDLQAEIAALDANLKRLKAVEKADADTAKPVNPAVDTPPRAAVSVRGIERTEPGIGFARMARCLGLAAIHRRSAVEVADMLYKNDARIAAVLKANVSAGSILGSTWGDELVGDETNLYTDFVDFLRPKTIVGRLNGQNGMPALRPAVFRTPLLSQTAGGTAGWVGEGKPIPLTNQGFGRTTLEPLKVAAITPITRELLQRSAPSVDVIIRDDLAAAIAQAMDSDFIDPANAGTSDVKPASITHSLAGHASSGNDADAVRADLGTLFADFDSVDQPLDSGAFLTSAAVVRRLSLMRNALGQREFPDLTVMGGTIEGIPILASNSVTGDSDGDIVVLINASDIWLGDENGVEIDLSDQASLQMVDAPTNDVVTPTATSLVSLWQNNAVAFRAMRTISWKKRRSTAVSLLTAVNWGQPTS